MTIALLVVAIVVGLALTLGQRSHRELVPGISVLGFAVALAAIYVLDTMLTN